MTELSASQRRYLERKATRKADILDCIRASKGISQAEISKMVGINRKYCAEVMKELKAEQKIHISSWMQVGGVLAALWVCGKGFDADRKLVLSSKAPNPVKKAEKDRLESEEYWVQVQQKKHEQWARTFVPRLDVAAAWLNNPIGG